jgi:hypothetical protein
MQLQSKFRLWAVFPLFIFLVLTATILYIVVGFFEYRMFPLWALFLFLAALGFVWWWIFFGEMRSKAVRVNLAETEMRVKGFFGLGAARIYQYAALEGFEISELPTSYSSYEYLYVYKAGKKVAKISDYYHRNYTEMKNFLVTKIEDLGEVEFSISQEFREIFTRQ